MLRELAGVKRIVIVTGRTDLRRGIPGLSALIRLNYGRDPLETGTLFLFCGNRRDRIKGLVLEDDGWLMLTKHVSNGVYQWPRDVQEARDITPEQFEHRMILRRAMLRHGFKALDSEWWHFTLKNEPFPDTYFTFPVKQLTTQK